MNRHILYYPQYRLWYIWFGYYSTDTFTNVKYFYNREECVNFMRIKEVNKKKPIKGKITYDYDVF